MSRGWTDDKSRFITNLLINSPSGSVFLESTETYAICKNGEVLFKFPDSLIQKFSKENVTHVIIDIASFVFGGHVLKKKYKKLFRDQVLHMSKDIGDLLVHSDKRNYSIYVLSLLGT